MDHTIITAINNVLYQDNRIFVSAIAQNRSEGIPSFQCDIRSPLGAWKIEFEVPTPNEDNELWMSQQIQLNSHRYSENTIFDGFDKETLFRTIQNRIFLPLPFALPSDELWSQKNDITMSFPWIHLSAISIEENELFLHGSVPVCDEFHISHRLPINGESLDNYVLSIRETMQCFVKDIQELQDDCEQSISFPFDYKPKSPLEVLWIHRIWGIEADIWCDVK